MMQIATFSRERERERERERSRGDCAIAFVAICHRIFVSIIYIVFVDARGCGSRRVWGRFLVFVGVVTDWFTQSV